MTERKALLTVYDDYTVEMYGKRLGLGSNIQTQLCHPGYGYAEYFKQRQRFQVSFEVFEYHEPPAPKRRRSMLELGLRRPK